MPILAPREKSVLHNRVQTQTALCQSLLSGETCKEKLWARGLMIGLPIEDASNFSTASTNTNRPTQVFGFRNLWSLIQRNPNRWDGNADSGRCLLYGLGTSECVRRRLTLTSTVVLPAILVLISGSSWSARCTDRSGKHQRRALQSEPKSFRVALPIGLRREVWIR